jgi:nucleotide-binding universal stress UspA family protein
MKAILVPIDFSLISQHAVNFAVDMAERMHDVRIILLNIIIPVHSGAFTASADVSKLQGATADRFNVEMMRKNEKLINEKIEHYRKRFSNIEGYVRFHEDKVNLNDFIDEFHADMVITGCENLDAFDAFLFGRKEEKIIRRTDVPVITVKQDPGKGTEFTDIVLAIDIEDDELKGMDVIRDVAVSMGSRLHLLYVITENDITTNKAIDSLDRIAHEYGLKKYTVNTVNNSNIEEGIRNFTRKKDADMIAVFSEGRGRLKQLVFGSTARDLVRDTDKPVLVGRLNGK